MNRYKPTYLGKVMPEPENTSALTDFMANKYTAFNKIYDSCKEFSDSISSIERITSDSDNLTIKIVSDTNTIQQIQQTSANDPSLSVSNAGILEVALST